MSAIISRYGLGVVALLLCGACESAPKEKVPAARATQSGSAAASGPTTTADHAPSAEPEKRKATTDPSIAVKNLNGKIPQAEKGLELQPDNVIHIQKLQGLLLLRSSKTGKISDLDRVVELGERAVKNGRKLKRAHLLRATGYSAVHRFADALKDLDKAEELGLAPSSAELSRASILIALGKLDEALAVIEARRQKHGEQIDVIYSEAMARGHMGQYAKADELFAQALEKYRSVSPFFVAQLEFERGSMWDRAGDEKKAEMYYRSAVERLPQFAHAAGHLAYKVPVDEGIALMKKTLETSDDPEYLGTLGHLMNQKEPGSGDEYIEKAKAGYAKLMKKHPLAFADHAGWFYTIIAKDYDKAIEAAEMNLDNRPTAEAYELMLAALVGAGQGTDACEVADRAVALKYRTPAVLRRAADAYEKCGRKDEAAELRKQANPR